MKRLRTFVIYGLATGIGLVCALSFSGLQPQAPETVASNDSASTVPAPQAQRTELVPSQPAVATTVQPPAKSEILPTPSTSGSKQEAQAQSLRLSDAEAYLSAQLSRGTWGVEQKVFMQMHLAELQPMDRERLLFQVVAAINEGRLQVDNLVPL